jgi:hypothetical protein
MIIAKPVIPNQYWILKKDNQKVGNIEAVDDGFSVKINNNITRFKTINMVEQRAGVNFETLNRCPVNENPNQVHDYPTNGKPHNSLFDVQHQLPLWTKDGKSKSWYAAGWYRVRIERHWKTVQCPKLITLRRYEYKGPFYTQEEATRS